MKNMKVSAYLILSFVLLLVFTGVCPVRSFGADGEYNFKFSTVLNEESSWYKVGVDMAEKLAKETEGKITITAYPNEMLAGGSQTKGLETVMKGIADFDLRASMLWAAVEKKFDVLSLPFFFDSEEEKQRQFSGPGVEALKKALEEKGIKILGFGEIGYFELLSSANPIAKLEDFQGFKLRLAPVPIHMDTAKALGANPMTISHSEQFPALQQGTVNGILNSLARAYVDGLYDVTKYLSVIKMIYGTCALSMNLNSWNSLTPELQELVQRVALECLADQIKQEKIDNEASIKQYEEKGLKVNFVSEEERARMREATKSVITDFEQAVGKDFVDLFRVK